MAARGGGKNTIHLSIESSFADKGFKQAINEINRLFNTVNRTMGKNGNAQLLESMADVTKELAAATQELANVTKQYNQAQQQQQRVQNNSTKSRNQANKAAQDSVDVLEREQYLLRRGNRLAGEVNKNLDERKTAIQEANAAAERLIGIETRLNKLRQQEKDILDKGNASAEERQKISREITRVEQELSRAQTKSEQAADRLRKAQEGLNRAREHYDDMGDFIKQNDLQKGHRLVKIYDDLADQIREVNSVTRTQQRNALGQFTANPQSFNAIMGQIAGVQDRVKSLRGSVASVRDGFASAYETINSGTLQMHRNTQKALDIVKRSYQEAMGPISKLDALQKRIDTNQQKRIDLAKKEQAAIQRLANARQKVAEIEQRALQGEKVDPKLERSARSELSAAERDLKAMQEAMQKLDRETEQTKQELVEFGRTAKNAVRQASDAIGSLPSQVMKELRGMRAVDLFDQMVKGKGTFDQRVSQMFSQLKKEQQTLRNDTKRTSQSLDDISDTLDDVTRSVDRNKAGWSQMSSVIGIVKQAYRDATGPMRQMENLQNSIERNQQKRIDLLAREQRAVQRVADAQQKVAEIERRALAGEKPNTRLETLARGDLRSAENELSRVRGELVKMDRNLTETEQGLIKVGQAAKLGLSMAKTAFNSLSTEMQQGPEGQQLQQQIQELTRIRGEVQRALNRTFSDLRSEQQQVYNQFRRVTSGLDQVQDGFDGLTRASSESAARWRSLNDAMSTSRSVAQQTSQVFRNLRSIMAQLANVVSGALINGLERASRALSTLSLSGAGRFAALRSNLDATGQAFNRFGQNVEDGMSRYDRALERTAAGWSMLLAGQSLTQMSNTLFRNVIHGVSDFLRFEEAATLAAVAGSTPENKVTPAYIMDMVYAVQRGVYGDPVKTLSSEEMAQGIYYYSSAIGQPITDENRGAILNALVPILQLAGFTQTSPETSIKGILNAAMEFGIDPRNISQSSPMLRDIANLYGYLANETTMEVPDINEFFKMVGPLAYVMSPQGSGGAIKEAMAFAYMASEMGLRGSSPGRGLNQLISSLLDPTDKANDISQELWGKGIYDQFFTTNEDGKYVLKGGLKGLFTPFLEMTDEEWKQAQSGLFTQNASRVAVPLIQQLRDTYYSDGGKDKWDQIMESLDSGEALEFVALGAQTASMTLSAAVQDMQNAWTEFVGTLMMTNADAITGFIGKIAGALREVSDIIHAIPSIGKFIAGLGAGIGAIMAVVGALLTTLGTLLILQRAFLIAGSGVSSFVAAFRAIPAILAMGLPVLAALTAGIIAFKIAWDANFLGIRDGIQKMMDLFSGNFSMKFLSWLDGEQFANIYKWVMRVAHAFNELVSGILFNVGDTNNLFSLMNSIFGTFLGSRINATLDALRGRLSDLRGAFKTFFSGIGEGIPSLSTFGNALRGVLEQLFLGFMSYDSFKAINTIGEWLGIDNLGVQAQTALRQVQGAISTLVGYVVSYGSVILGVFAQIWDNIRQIFTLDNLGSVLSFVGNVLIGIGGAIAAAFYVAVQAVEAVTSALANLGSIGAAINNNIIEPLTGMRLSLDNLGIAIGTVFGTMLAGRVMMAISPIRTLISYTGQIGFTLAGVGVQAAGLTAQLGVLAARFVLVRGVSMVSDAAIASWQNLSRGIAAIGRELAPAAVRMAGVTLAATGLIGILALAAGGIYAYVAATRGFGEANALAKTFFDTVITGAKMIGAVLMVAANIVKAFLSPFMTIGQFMVQLVGLENVIRALAVAITALAGIALAAQILRWGASITTWMGSLRQATTQTRQFATEIRAVQQVQFGSILAQWRAGIANFGTSIVSAARNALNFRTALMGFGALYLLFDPLYSAVDTLIAKFVELIGVTGTAGAALHGALSGAVGGAVMGGMMFGVPGAVIGGVAGAAYGGYKSWQAEKAAQEKMIRDAALAQVQADLGSDVKVIPTTDVAGVTYTGDRFVSFEGINPTTGKQGKFTVDLETQQYYDYGAYRLPGTTSQQILSNAGIQSPSAQDFSNQVIALQNEWTQKGYYEEWSKNWRQDWKNLSDQQRKDLEKIGVYTEQGYVNYRWYDSAQHTIDRMAADHIARGGVIATPPSGYIQNPNFEAGDFSINSGQSFTQIPVSPGVQQQAEARVMNQYTELGSGGRPVSQLEQLQQLNHAKRMFQATGLGRVFDAIPNAAGFLNAMGLGGQKVTVRDQNGQPIGQYQLSDLLAGSERTHRKTKYDDFLPDFLPKDLQAEINRWQKQQSDWDRWQQLLTASGGDAEHASRIWEATTGRSTPVKPQGLDKAIDTFLSDPFNEEALAQAEFEQQAWIDFNNQLMDAYHSIDLPTAMKAIFSGPSFRTSDGFLARTMSGFEVAMGLYGTLAQNIGDAIPWMSEQEMLADFAKHGMIGGNFAGRRLDKALAPVLEQWSIESGIPVADLVKNLPTYYHDPKYMPQATVDLGQAMMGMGSERVGILDHLGAKYGYGKDGAGFSWTDLTQYAISKAEAGQMDWNLVDFLVETWNISEAEARRIIGENPMINENTIKGTMFADTQGMINSMGGEVVALTKEWYDYINEVTQNGTDRTVEITQEAYNALPDYVKMAMAQMGYQFVIGGEQNIQQAQAHVKMLEDRLTATYGETFTAIQDEIKRGVEPINRWTDEHGTEWVDILDEATGKTFSIPAVEYEAYKSSLDAANEATKNFFDNYQRRFEQYFGARGADGKIVASTEYKMAVGMGMGSVYETGFDYGYTGGSAPTAPAELPGLPPTSAYESRATQDAQAYMSAFTSGLSAPTTAPGGTTTTASTQLLDSIKLDPELITSKGREEGAKVASALIAGIQQGLSQGMGTGALPEGVHGPVMQGVGTSVWTSWAETQAQGAAEALKTAFQSKMPTAMQDVMSSALSTDVAVPQGEGGGAWDAWATAQAESAATALETAFNEKMPTAIQDALSNLSAGSEGGDAEFKIPIDLDTMPAMETLGELKTILAAVVADTESYKIPIDLNKAPAEAANNVIVQMLTDTTSREWLATIDVDNAVAKGMIQEVLDLLADVARVYTAGISVIDNASGTIKSVLWGLQQIDGYTATASITTTETTVRRYVNAGFDSGARGTVAMARGGTVTLVGERGPELLMLPYGSRVVSNFDSMRMLREQAGYGMSAMTGGAVTGHDLSTAISSSSIGLTSPRPTPTRGSFQANANQAHAGGGEGVNVNFYGPVEMKSEADAKRLAEQVKRVVSHEFRLAERGMTSTDI